MLLQRLFFGFQIFISVFVFVIKNPLRLNLSSAQVQLVLLLVHAKFSLLYLLLNVFILALKLLDFCLHRVVLALQLVVLGLKFRIFISQA